MPRFDPAEFGRPLARLTPQELRHVEGLVADARKRAEAVLEIDVRTAPTSMRSGCCSLQALAPTRLDDTAPCVVLFANLGLRGSGKPATAPETEARAFRAPRARLTRTA